MNENQNIEWKSSWRDEYLKWVCAFANEQGGKLFIGKDDTGKVVHLSNFKKLLEDIPAKIKNYLGIICSVMLKEEAAKKYIEIEVKPYSVPVSYSGKFYVRSGSTTTVLTGIELTEFLLKKTGKTWDDVIVEDATIADINSKAIQQFIEDSNSPEGKNRMPETKGLSNFDILDKLRLTENKHLKRAALVLFANDPNRFFTNCKVMIGRFRIDSTDLIFQEVVEGNLIHTLHEVITQLNHKFLIRKVDFKGMLRIEQGEYPLAALREMLLNALVHKNYMGAATIQLRVFDDRITIWNEGKLPDGLNAESLLREHSSRPRNPFIADACFKAGYIDTWGRGTLKIINTCTAAGLPTPQIIEKDGGIEVTLFKSLTSNVYANSGTETPAASNFESIVQQLTNKPENSKQLFEQAYQLFTTQLSSVYGFSSEQIRNKFGINSEQIRNKFSDNKALLIFMIALRSDITASNAAQKLGLNQRTIENYLAELKQAKIISREGANKTGYWTISI